MRALDKLVLAVVGAIVVIGAVWFLLVSPERHQASALSAKITAEQSSLASAEDTLDSARAVAAGYPADVKAIAKVTTAIPSSMDEPSVITTLTKLAGTSVDVHAITVGGSGSSAPGTTSLGLTLTFYATYGSLQHFLTQLDQLVQTQGGNLEANGRLFTVAGVTLTPNGTSGTEATVTAAAYAQSPSGATGATGVSSTAAVTP